MDKVVATDPEILSGTPCFSGTRVPIRSLFEYLEAGYSIDYYLEQFPSIERGQVQRLLLEVSHETERRALAEATR